MNKKTTLSEALVPGAFQDLKKKRKTNKKKKKLLLIMLQKRWLLLLANYCWFLSCYLLVYMILLPISKSSITQSQSTTLPGPEMGQILEETKVSGIVAILIGLYSFQNGDLWKYRGLHSMENSPHRFSKFLKWFSELSDHQTWLMNLMEIIDFMNMVDRKSKKKLKAKLIREGML